MSDQAFRTRTRITYLTPTSENIFGYIVDELSKQMTGANKRDYAEFGMPAQRTLAMSIVFNSGPLQLTETIEINEPQGVPFISNYSTQGV